MNTSQDSNETSISKETTGLHPAPSGSSECQAEYRLRIDGKRFELPNARITGEEILRLVDKSANDYCLFQKRKGDRQLIQPDDVLDLSKPGVETYKTRLAIQICVENRTLPWCKRTITTEEIAALGGWDISQGVIEVDDEQNERTLAPGETIKLRPGHQFGKKHCWKRG